ncbi:polysaccharide deacetylase family protein [Symmachiella dynata]|uniref:polysaccharide deacetylase family protein n=1 Tax=Symmachiella dynata TaxID=2527995 RepID=UPI0030ED6FC4
MHRFDALKDASAQSSPQMLSRRAWLRRSAIACGGLAMCGWPAPVLADQPKKARVAITLDLEMSRNFPEWDDTQWDYEKGNLDAASKKYAVDAGRRVKARGGQIHYFCVGRVLEQPDISWLQELAKEGHPIGNHTYDHVYLLAKNPQEIQYRFQRCPWLIEGRTTKEVINENIRLATLALEDRAGIKNRGFRTPGGFSTGLSGREDLQQMLLDAGFTWVSSKYPSHDNTKPMEQPTDEVYDSIVNAQAAAQPFVYPTGLVEIPMSPISDIGAFRGGRWKLSWFLEAVRRSVAWTIENKAVFDFLAHPSCLGVIDPKFETIDLICDMVEQAGDDAQLVNLDQIASGRAIQK